MIKRILLTTLISLTLNHAFANGYLMLIGGHLEADNQLIWDKIKALGKISTQNSKEPLACILVTNTGEPDDSAEYYTEIFKEYGMQSQIIPIYYNSKLKPEWKNNQNSTAVVNQIKECNIYFFTGGDQSRTTNVLFNNDGSETLALKTLRQELDKNKLLAGTSAGDMMQSNPMITGGTYNKESKQDTVSLGKGLGFLEPNKIIVDSHFSQRNRLDRLIKAMEKSDINTGIGVDEETALYVEVNKNGDSVSNWTAVGKNQVVIVEINNSADHKVKVSYLNNGEQFKR